jgi:hypothetical protein
MKVKELIQMLRKSNQEDNVVIGTSDDYMGQKRFVGIAHLYNGFDWEDGYTYIIGNMDLYTESRKK